jgi:carbamoyltransferase
MNILGLNYFFHDSTAYLVVDGKLIAAIEEERLTRIKHTGAFPRNVIARCLKMSGLEAGKIDAVAVSIKPSLHWGSKAGYALKNFTKAAPILGFSRKTGRKVESRRASKCRQLGSFGAGKPTFRPLKPL